MRISGTLSTLSLLLLGLSSASPFSSDGLDKRATTFTNPILWEDYPDLEVIRVGDVFYYTSSTFAFSPGAPILKSYDLINWTPVSHSVPTLNFGSKYNLTSATDRAYVKGIWASSLRYRESTDTFYWMGCVESSNTYIWTATGTGAAKNGGEVSKWDWKAAATLPKCYYDNGLLVDDDDTMYVAYGNTNIMVAQLSKDGLSETKSQQVYVPPDNTYIEGSRMYKINGTYYIFVTKPANEEWVLKSKSPWGPYEKQVLVASITGPLANAGAAHQGGIVDIKNGQWYYVAFMDAYPGGRIPVAAPLEWTADGWPQLVKDGSSWGKTYPFPIQTNKTVPSPIGTDTFQGPSLSHEWEWNHNPDTSKFKLLGGSRGGLLLQTATVTNDLFTARNTLTHRIIGPKSSGTFRLNVSGMRDGDRAGAALFRDVAAYIGVHKDGNTTKVVYVNNLTLDSNWFTISTGTIAATGPTIDEGTKDLWFQVRTDITPAFGTSTNRTTTFWYSTNGSKYVQLGGAFAMTNTWQFFTGYRFAAFNFATKALGGQITAKSFTMAML